MKILKGCFFWVMAFDIVVSVINAFMGDYEKGSFMLLNGLFMYLLWKDIK